VGSIPTRYTFFLRAVLAIVTLVAVAG